MAKPGKLACVAVVARARRFRRGARRAAPPVVGLAFLALALGVGGWPPDATAPALSPAALTAPAELTPIAADPVVALDATGEIVLVDTMAGAVLVSAMPGAVLAKTATGAALVDTTAGAVVLDPTAGGFRVDAVLAGAGTGTGVGLAGVAPFPTVTQPVDARPLALPAPVDTRARAQAIRSAAGTRAPPRAA